MQEEKQELKNEFNDAFGEFMRQVKIALLEPVAVKAIVIFFLVALGYLLAFTVYTSTYERVTNNRIRSLEISMDSLQVEMINLKREMKESYLMSAKRDAQIISVIEKIFKGRQNENSK